MKIFFEKLISQKDMPAFIFIIATGTLNHFLYEWTGSAIVTFFCPVNESVWEHLKLLFFPFLFWSIGKYFCRKPEASSYFFYRFLAVSAGMLSIITLFYTYTGIIGRNFLPLDILTFVLGTIITLRLTSLLPKHITSTPAMSSVYTAWLTVILCFFTFTCFPPDIPLFFASGTPGTRYF